MNCAHKIEISSPAPARLHLSNVSSPTAAAPAAGLGGGRKLMMICPPLRKADSHFGSSFASIYRGAREDISIFSAQFMPPLQYATPSSKSVGRIDAAGGDRDG